MSRLPVEEKARRARERDAIAEGLVEVVCPACGNRCRILPVATAECPPRRHADRKWKRMVSSGESSPTLWTT